MRFKPKDTKTTVVILALAAALIVVLRLTGLAGSSSAVKLAYVGSAGRHVWYGRYSMLDGTMEKALFPEGDTLTVTVETKSGELSIELRDSDSAVIFDGDDMESGSVTVDVPEKVNVLIEAEKHKGSFDIR